MITLIIYLIRTKSRLFKNISYYFIVLLKNDSKNSFSGVPDNFWIKISKKMLHRI